LRHSVRIAAVLAVAAALVAPAGHAGGGCSPASDWPAANSGYAAEVVALVNDHRASLGLGSLQISSSLTAAAVWKAQHMAEYLYMQHDDPAPPVARGVGSRLSACGYSGGGWGENIAYGYPSPGAVVNAWLNSSGHRANIENPAFTSIGVGAAAADSGTMYWAQDFGASGGGPPPQPDPPAGDPPEDDPPAGDPPVEEPPATGTDDAPAPDAPIGGSPAADEPSGAEEAEPEQPSGDPSAALAPATVRAGLGSRRYGTVSSLAVDDGRVLVVRSPGPRTTWRASIPGVPNDLDALRVSLRGSSSNRCRQVLELWSFERRTWVPVASRSVGRAEAALRVVVTRRPAEYVSRLTGDGAVSVRVTCVRPGKGALTARADLLSVTVDL
jgi:uncharacterized protein YkwD